MVCEFKPILLHKLLDKLDVFSFFRQHPFAFSPSLPSSLSLCLLTPVPPPSPCNLLCHWMSVSEDESALVSVLTPGLAGHVYKHSLYFLLGAGDFDDLSILTHPSTGTKRLYVSTAHSEDSLGLVFLYQFELCVNQPDIEQRALWLFGPFGQ